MRRIKRSGRASTDFWGVSDGVRADRGEPDESPAPRPLPFQDWAEDRGPLNADEASRILDILVGMAQRTAREWKEAAKTADDLLA